MPPPRSRVRLVHLELERGRVHALHWMMCICGILASLEWRDLGAIPLDGLRRAGLSYISIAKHELELRQPVTVPRKDMREYHKPAMCQWDRKHESESAKDSAI